jgi:hypothetical protein
MTLYSRLPLQAPLVPQLDPVPGITVNRAPDHFTFQDRIVGSLLGAWANLHVPF